MWRWLFLGLAGLARAWEELRWAPEQLLELVLAVRHTSEPRLLEALRRVSSPRSSEYGRYWALDAAKPVGVAV